MSSNLEAFNRAFQVFASGGFQNSNPEQEKNFHEYLTDDAVVECHYTETEKTNAFNGVHYGYRGFKSYITFYDLITPTQLTPTIIGEQGDDVYVRFTFVPVAAATGMAYQATITTMETFTFKNGKICRMVFMLSFPNYPSVIL